MWADGKKNPKLTPAAVEAIAAAEKSREAARAPDPAILMSLIRKWRSCDPNRPSSPEWERLSANTKETWGSALDRIEEKWG